MRSNNRYALLFILLVIGQEFCLARHAYLQTVSDHRLEKRGIQFYGFVKDVAISKNFLNHQTPVARIPDIF